MGLHRRILFVTVCVVAAALLGRLIPKWIAPAMQTPHPFPSQSPHPTPSKTDSIVPLPLAEVMAQLGERFLESFSTQTSSVLHKGDTLRLLVPKGKPIHEYALWIENQLRQLGAAPFIGNEFPKQRNRLVYHVDRDSSQQVVLLRYGKAYLPRSTRIGLVFTGLDSCDARQVAGLEKVAWQKTIVLDPYTENQNLLKLQYAGPETEVFLHAPMEPASYPHIDPGPEALMIHHSEQEIHARLERRLQKFQNSRGFMSQYGERAVGHAPLVEKLFRFLSPRDLVFLDATGSNRSVTSQIASQMNATSWFVQAVPAEEAIPSLRQKIGIARKKGEALLLIHYSPKGFEQFAEHLEKYQQEYQKLGIELTRVSQLR